MRTWIISNTKFGYKNGNAQWLSQMMGYFNTEFIQHLEKKAKQGDILIHLGNLFDGSEHISTTVLNSVQDLFERLSSYIPIKILTGSGDIANGSKNNSVNSINVFQLDKH